MLRQLLDLTNRSSCSGIVPIRSISLLSRLWRGQQATCGTNEVTIKEILRKEFPRATTIEVNDISAVHVNSIHSIWPHFYKGTLDLCDTMNDCGCGAMYDISVVAPEFQGLRMVKQHQMINEALKKEIKDMHGLRIHTSVPASSV